MSVCLSVCLSHAGILSKRLNVLSNFLHLREATLFYFFRAKRYGPLCDLLTYLLTYLLTMVILQHIRRMQGNMKNRDCRPISRFNSEMIPVEAIVTTECDRKLHPSFRMVPYSMTFSDLEYE